MVSARSRTLLYCCTLFFGCASTSPTSTPQSSSPQLTPVTVQPKKSLASTYPSTYRAKASAPTVIRHATILTGTGERLNDADVAMVDGRIQAIGRNLSVPAGAQVIDATGRWVTPGLIDVHSHLGVYPSPAVNAHEDGNEMSDPVTPNVWAEHSVWPQDPGFETALAGGVTSLQVLPGSANLIGGRGVTLKNVPASSYQAMKFPSAMHGLKMACGENPKRVYGGKERDPQTRMGNMAGYRQAFADAQEYQRAWEKYARELAEYEKKKADSDKKSGKEKSNKDKKASGESKPEESKSEEIKPPDEPKRDLALETLRAAMEGKVLVHIHCYRADEMQTMLDLADEFGFKIAAFHHGVEAYKVADRLADKHVCGALWADWWGFKMEAFDGIQENIAMVDAPKGGCAIVHSDSEEGIQRLNQEAAKAMTRGNRVGLPINRERAIGWITSNAAKALGIDDRTGSLEVGKMADIVIWNRDPFSVYALADQVFIDGALQFDRAHPAATPRSDFMLGQPTSGDAHSGQTGGTP